MTERRIACAHCGFENPPGMRFCGGCGRPLTAEKVEEELKEVAVLFADICDFTTLVASGDVEDTKSKVDACLKLMADRVEAFGGVAEKFIGDALMATFGLPFAHENDAERAVRSAASLLENVRHFGAEVGLAIELRVGVNFGGVIAAVHDGGPGREHAIFGETVNMAARLQETGEAGAVVVGEEVAARTRAFFEYERLKPVVVKGRTEPLPRYRLRGLRKVPGKVRGVQGLTSPMIGRKDEMARLRAAYEKVAAGKGAAFVAVVGEPGIGKTRLVEEFLRALEREGEEPLFLHGRCLAHEAGTSYLPFARIIKTAAGIKDDTPDADAEAMLGRMVTAAVGSTHIGDIDAVRILGELLALGRSREEGRHAEQIRAQLFVVVERVLKGLGAARPAVLLVEDLHWADNASLALARHLARNLGAARCLVLLNSRPPDEYRSALSDFLDTLALVGNFDLLTLRDLTPDESRVLIQALLAVEQLPAATRETIVARAGGNPFFVEELIKVLIEEGVIVRRGVGWAATEEIGTVELPRSIDAVLRARVDNLPGLEKRVLQRASVVGRVFWSRIVGALLEEPADEHLSALERRDLIRRRLESVFEDDREYAFKHALLQDSVYNGLLKRVRRELHLKAAAWLEENAGERAAAYFSLMAYHLDAGGEKTRAADYYFRAAERAANLFANDDARRFYERAAALGGEEAFRYRVALGWGDAAARINRNEEALEKFEEARTYAATPEEEADALRRKGDVFEKMSAYTTASDLYREGAALVADRPASVVKSALTKSEAWISYLRGDFEEGLTLARAAEECLAEVADEGYEADMVRAQAANVMGALLRAAGRAEESHRCYERTMALYEKHGHLFGICTTLNNMGAAEMAEGDFGAALEHLHASFDMGDRAGHRFSQAVNCCNLGNSYLALGDYVEAGRWFEIYLRLNAAVGNRLGDGYAHAGLADITREEGDVEKAAAHYREAIRIFEEVGAAGNARATRLDYATLLPDAGRDDEGRDLLRALRRELDDDVRRHEVIALAATARRRPLTADEGSYARKLLTAPLAESDDFSERIAFAGAAASLWRRLGEEESAHAAEAKVQLLAGRALAGLKQEALRAAFNERLKRVILFT